MSVNFVLGIENEIKENVIEKYLELGGEILDLSSLYENGEKFIGNYNNRKKFKIFTKIGLSKKNPGLSKKSIFLSFERSMKNLKLENIDTVFVHAWDLSKNPSEIGDSLLKLKEKHNVKIGVSNTPAWIISQLGIFQSIQMELNLCNHTSLIELAPMAIHNKLETYTYSPFYDGLIFKPNKIYKKEYRVKIKKIKKEFENLARVSLHFQLKNNFTTIIRTNSTKHIEENYGYLNEIIDEEEIGKLKKYTKLPEISPYNVLNSNTVRNLFQLR